MHLYIVTLYIRQPQGLIVWEPLSEFIFLDPTPAKECADDMVKWAEVQNRPLRVVRRRIWWTNPEMEAADDPA